MEDSAIKKSDLNLLLESYKNAVETNLTNMEKQDQVIKLLLESIETSKKLVDSIFLILKTLENNNLKCSGERKLVNIELSKVYGDLHNFVNQRFDDLIKTVEGSCNELIGSTKDKIDEIEDALSVKLDDTNSGISGINLNLSNKGNMYAIIGSLITAIMALIGLLITLYTKNGG